MTFDEIITRSERFAEQLAAKLSDPNETITSKQVYFMDEHERIQKVMSALNEVISLTDTAIREPDSVVGDEERETLQRAENVASIMRMAISNFQKSLAIDENVEVTNTPALTEQAISDVTAGNKKTGYRVETLEANSDEAIALSNFNYALCVNGMVSFIHAGTIEELNKAINDVANDGNGEDIILYQIQATPVPLKKKVILSI